MSNIITATKTIIGEAREESFRGQVAVAWVIRNRAQDPGWWGGPDWESVCLEDWQFSCWNDKQYGGQPFLRDLSTEDILEDNAYRQCLRAVLAVYDDKIGDPTSGATHYVVTSWLHDPDLRPDWADELTQVAEIGHHSFFTR